MRALSKIPPKHPFDVIHRDQLVFSPILKRFPKETSYHCFLAQRDDSKAMNNETKEEGLSRRNFLIGLGGGVIGAAALASAATPERKYIGANTSWVDFGDGTRAFLTQPQQGRAPFRAVILGHERYGLVQHTLDLAAKFAA